MIRVILESPYAAPTPAGVERNLRYLRACMRDCLLRGESPYASHGLYTQPGVLDDRNREDRQLGIAAGFEWRSAADKTVIYVDLKITDGMRAGVDSARDMRQLVEERSIGMAWDVASPPTWDDLHSALARLVRFLDKHGGYMSPEHQASLRNAKALLAGGTGDDAKARLTRTGEPPEGGK